MKKQITHRIILSLLINALIACISIFVFGTHLDLDDDSILSWMTYGIISEASSRTYYTNAILGWVYKHLFSLISEFNWQTLVHYLGLVGSGTIGLYAVLKKNNKVLTILWFLFELTFFYDVYICLTYSVVSAFVAYQAYLALFLAIKENKIKVVYYITCGMVLLFSSMIRFDSFLGASGYAFVVWLLLALKERPFNKEFLKKYIYPFIAIIGICFLFRGVDKAAYNEGEWKEFSDYAAVRSVLTDHRNSVSLMNFDELAEIGINPSMGQAVAEWRNNDPEILSKETLDLMASTEKQYNYLGNPVIWSDFFEQMKIVFTNYFEIYFSFFTLAFSLYSGLKKDRKDRVWMYLLLLLPFLGEFFYFSFIGRIDGGEFPERCIYIVLGGLAIGAMTLYGVNEQESQSVKGLSNVILGTVILASLIVQPTKEFSIRGLGLVDGDSIQKEYGFLGRGEKVYVCEYDVRTELEQSFGAWQTPKAGFMSQTVEIGSWLINHPMEKAHREALGCINPYRALYENENVYYIRRHDSEQYILEYLRENYDKRIDVDYIKQKGDFKVFKFSIGEND